LPPAPHLLSPHSAYPNPVMAPPPALHISSYDIGDSMSYSPQRNPPIRTTSSPHAASSHPPLSSTSASPSATARSNTRSQKNGSLLDRRKELDTTRKRPPSGRERRYSIQSSSPSHRRPSVVDQLVEMENESRKQQDSAYSGGRSSRHAAPPPRDETTPIIRPLIPKDVNLLHKLEAKVAAFDKAPRRKGADIPRCLQRALHYGESFTVVAEVRNKIMGVVSGSIKMLEFGGDGMRIAYGYDLVIHPKFRGTGVASSLVGRMNEQFRKRQADWQYVFLTGTPGALVVSNPTFDRYALRPHGTPVRIHCWPVEKLRGSTTAGIDISEPDVNETSSYLRGVFGNDDMLPSELEEIIHSQYHLGTVIARSEEEGEDSEACLSVWDCTSQGREDIVWSKLPFRTRILSGVLTTMMPCMDWNDMQMDNNMEATVRARMLYGVHCSGADGLKLLAALVDFVHNIAHDEKVDLLYCPLLESHPAEDAIPSWSNLTDTVTMLAGPIAQEVTPIGDHFFLDPRDF